jgi:hypothetical protein
MPARRWGRKEPFTLLVQISEGTMEIRMKTPQNTKNITTILSCHITPRHIYPKECKLA